MPQIRFWPLTSSTIAILWMISGAVSYPSRGAENAAGRFQEYRACLQKGDTAAAVKVVTGLSGQDSTLEAQMANFLLAKLAWDHGDTSGALAFLDQGTPRDLWDHVAYLRATILSASHRDSLAAPQWSLITCDSSSVFAEDALYQLALDTSAGGRLDSLSHILDLQDHLIHKHRRPDFEWLMARALAAHARHQEAVERMYALAVTYAYCPEGQSATAQLASYHRDYGFRPRAETTDELEGELANLADHNRLVWGLDRVKDEFVRLGWEKRNDLLLFYKGRFESGLGKHRQAIRDLKNHVAAYPKGRFASRALFFLGRSEYLSGQDSLAISPLMKAAAKATDTVLINKALEVLGLLYMDRQQPAEAAVVLQRWALLSRGLESHADALWRLAWALWEMRNYRAAGQTWTELSQLSIDSEYLPASLYWSARAAEQVGESESAASKYRILDSLYAFSYYSVARRRDATPLARNETSLIPPEIEDLCVASGVHTRKFGLLASMQLADLAVREWPAAQEEQSDSAGLAWWKAQAQYWQGRRLDAWLTMRSQLLRFVQTPGQRPADFYRIAYPRDFADSVAKISAEFKLDPFFVMGLICQESHFEEDITSGAGAIGLMQLMPGTASLTARKLGIRYSRSELYSARYNLRLGIAHLAELLQEWNGDTILVLASYNAGKNVVLRWQAQFGNRTRDEFVELIPYRETRLFVKRVTEHIAAYRRLYPNLAG